MKISKYLLFALLSLTWACDGLNNGNKNVPVAEIDSLVSAIVVDQYNTKWIGTDAGLYRSVEEGFQLQDLTVTGRITMLYYESSGDILWVGTESGLVKATIREDDLKEEIVDSEQLSDPSVLSMLVDSDAKYWFGTEQGISMNDGELWKKEDFAINTLGTLFAIGMERFEINSIATWDGDYFFATSGASLYRAYAYDETVNAFTGATQWSFPYNGESISDTMFVVFVDNEGKQWMGGEEGIQVHTGHDPKLYESFTYYYYELPDYYVLAISQAPNGDMWVGTRNGLCVFDGSNWETINDGLPDLHINAIAFDEEGGAWIGTNKGLANIN